MAAPVSSIPTIVRQHAEGAAFLWAQRAGAMHDGTMGETEVGRIDLRLGAHLSGLQSSGARAQQELLARFEDFSESGEAFALIVNALNSGDAKWVSDILDVLVDFPEAWPGLSGGIAWAGSQSLGGYVTDWGRSEVPLLRYLSIVAHSHHRIDPGAGFSAMLGDADPMVRGRALRLIGELGRADILPEALSALQSTNEAERFGAARSALLLGAKDAALPVLQLLATTAVDGCEDAALELAMVGDEGPETRYWLGTLMQDPNRAEAAVRMAGEIRFQDVRDWLIDLGADPERSAAVGEALRAVYDFDFDNTDAFEPDPDLLGEGFADRTDGPWPVPDRVKAAIRDHAGSGSFRPICALRRQNFRDAIGAPGRPLADWRYRRVYPAWS